VPKLFIVKKLTLKEQDNNSVVCLNCGAQNAVGKEFCDKCGKKILAQSQSAEQKVSQQNTKETTIGGDDAPSVLSARRAQSLLEEDRSVDLSNESAEQLENQKRFQEMKKKVDRKNIKGAIYFVVVLAIMWLFVLIFKPQMPIMPYYLNIVLYGALSIASIIVLLFLIATLAKKSSPIPLAGRTPEETIKQFLNSPLHQIAPRFGEDWLESYVCLLDQLKNKERSFADFVKDMKKMPYK
jgi:ribosomal protein L40E